jgi:hypothetical protein
VLQMLLHRVVALLPSIKRLATEKAHHVVGALGMRLEKESGFRELTQTRQSWLSLSQRMGSYRDWGQRLVRPLQSLRRTRHRACRLPVRNGLRVSERVQAILENEEYLVGIHGRNARRGRAVCFQVMIGFAQLKTAVRWRFGRAY